MQTRSSDWRSIVATKNFWLEVKATINGVSYTSVADDGNPGLTAPVIDRAMFTNDLSVGNCIAASCTFSVMANNSSIPKSAEVLIEGRVCRENPSNPGTPIKSEYRPFGTFYVSKRTENKEKGLVALQCYDAMLKANQLYITNPSADPTERQGWTNGRAMSQCVTDIATRIGVSLDSRTSIRSGDAYKIQYPAHYVKYSNLNTETGTETEETKQASNYTMTDVLSLIAGVHGGNWVITPENKLRLIPLTRPPSSSSSSDDGATASEAAQMTVSVPIVIGKIDTGKQLSVTRISVSRDKEEVYQKGNSNGIDLNVSGSPYETVLLHTTARDYLYSTFNGLTYNPFTIEKACMDPCAELGDRVVVKEGNTYRVLSVICSQRLTFGNEFRVNLSAPAKVEEESEYPFQTQTQKLQGQLKKLQATSESFIEQTNNRIALRVTEKGLVGTLNSQLEVTGNAITVSTGHFIVNGDADPSTVNFKLDANGNIWAKNASLTNVSATGTITSEVSYNYGGTTETQSTSVSQGQVSFYKNGALSGFIDATSTADPMTGGASRDVLAIRADSASAITFGIPWTGEGDYAYEYELVINNGLNPWGYTEPIYAGADVRLNSSVFVTGTINRGTKENPDDHTGSVEVRYTEMTGSRSPYVGVYGGLYVDGDLSVHGTNKARVVDTDNYGTVALCAMESTRPVFSDLGSGLVGEDGFTCVFLDPDFVETVVLSCGYHVFLTQTSLGTIEFTEKMPDHFIVHGIPGTTFDWIVYAAQKGSEGIRLDQSCPPERDLNMEAGTFPMLPPDSMEQLASDYLNSYEEEIYGKRS